MRKMKQTLMEKFTDLSSIMSDKVAAGSCNISQVATLVDSMVKIYKAINEENKDRKLKKIPIGIISSKKLEQ